MNIMKKPEEETITMEVTKSEAMMVLEDRQENKWYVALEPVLILVPGMAIAYLLYELITGDTFSLKAIIAVLPIFGLCFYLLIKQMRKRISRAEELFKQMKEKINDLPPLR